ncbi:MAG: hypothetical protein KatS3mg087_0283 [Patescibacteria group bacterium]|nr:MAG: hypothetical protein KatS3mg087_0283 [Patescibacteria group bacterium]
MKTNQVNLTSPDIYSDLMKILKEQHPSLFANDGSVDADGLRNLLERFKDEMTEKVWFRWEGKQRARKDAYTPSQAALRN